MQNIAVIHLSGNELPIRQGTGLEILTGLTEGKLATGTGGIEEGVGIGGAVLLRGSILRSMGSNLAMAASKLR